MRVSPWLGLVGDPPMRSHRAESARHGTLDAHSTPENEAFPECLVPSPAQSDRASDDGADHRRGPDRRVSERKTQPRSPRHPSRLEPHQPATRRAPSISTATGAVTMRKSPVTMGAFANCASPRDSISPETRFPHPTSRQTLRPGTCCSSSTAFPSSWCGRRTRAGSFDCFILPVRWSVPFPR
jgi:hypothetical protein